MLVTGESSRTASHHLAVTVSADRPIHIIRMGLTRVAYFRFSALLPLVLPFPLAGVVVGSVMVGVKLPEWLSRAAMTMVMGTFLFGPVYAVLVAMLLYVLRHSSWERHAIGALVAPWFMILAVASFSTIVEGDTLSMALNTWSAYCLGVGYTYVALMFVGLVMLQRVGWIRHDVQ